MFYGCNSLESIDLSYFNTSLVRDLREMFFNCTSLKSIDLSNFNTSLVTNIESMLDGCSSLRFIDISNFNLKKIITCSGMFSYCDNIKYIKLLNIETSTTFLNYIRGDDGLNNDDNLTICQNSDIITNPKAKYVCCNYNIETNSCYFLNFIDLYFNEKCNYSNGFKNKYRDGINFIKYNNSIKSNSEDLQIKADSIIEIHFNNDISKIDNFFSQVEDKNLQYVTFIDLSNFDASLITNMSSLFSECISLKSINFKNINTSSVIDMSNMFYHCSSLELEQLSTFETSKVINMANMFNGCSSIMILNLSNFKTASVTNMYSLFRNCNQLISLDISNFDISKVTSISYFFSQCSKLKTVYYLSNLDSPNSVNRLGMFDGCLSLFSPDNPNYQANFNESDIISTNLITSSNITIVILLFNKLAITNSRVSFNIYFLSFVNFNFPQTFNLSVEIIYNLELRFLDIKNVQCQLEHSFDDTKKKYNCIIDIQNSNIKTISINKDIDFELDNINMEKTPLISNYLNNIQNIPKTYDNLSDDLLNIYRLKNCIITNAHENSFNIVGLMEGEPKYSLGINLLRYCKSC